MRRLVEEGSPGLVLGHGSAPGHRRSASLETGYLGRAALESLVELKTSADALLVAKAQAHKLQHTTLVSNLRALEAQNVLKYLRDQAEGEGLPGQMASGPGFGFGEESKPRSPMLGDITSVAGGFGRGLTALGGLAGKLATASSGDAVESVAGDVDSGRREEHAIDNDSVKVQDDISEIVDLTLRARRDATRLAEFIGRASDKANLALRGSAVELNIPGFPPPPLPRPATARTAPRPADLAPAWLDFLHASPSPKTDPYPPLPFEERDPLGRTESMATPPGAEFGPVAGKAGRALAAGNALAAGKPVDLGGLLKALA